MPIFLSDFDICTRLVAPTISKKHAYMQTDQFQVPLKVSTSSSPAAKGVLVGGSLISKCTKASCIVAFSTFLKPRLAARSKIEIGGPTGSKTTEGRLDLTISIITIYLGPQPCGTFTDFVVCGRGGRSVRGGPLTDATNQKEAPWLGI